MNSRPQTSPTDSLRGANSYAFDGFVGAFLGIWLGGIGGFIFPEPFYRLTNPQFLQDGQWAMVFFKSVPAGILIGFVVGLVAGLRAGHKIK